MPYESATASKPGDHVPAHETELRSTASAEPRLPPRSTDRSSILVARKPGRATVRRLARDCCFGSVASLAGRRPPAIVLCCRRARARSRGEHPLATLDQLDGEAPRVAKHGDPVAQRRDLDLAGGAGPGLDEPGPLLVDAV